MKLLNGIPAALAVLVSLAFGSSALGQDLVGWGNNSAGQLNVPALPAGMSDVEIVAGADHAFAWTGPTDTTWTNLAGATTGSAGQPSLIGSGPLSAGSIMTLKLSNGPSSDIALLWVALAPTPIPAVGGTLHAFPFDVNLVLFTNPSGEINIPALVAAGVPTGTEINFQYICKDAANPHGITLSNGLKGTTP